LSKGITTEDYVAISDHMGRYCWLIDEGHADEWVALWTEDGIFTFIGGPETLHGREALKGLAVSFAQTGGMRHLLGNLYCDYGASRDTVIAHAYNFVSKWSPGGAFMAMALCVVTLVRDGSGWKIKRNDSTLLSA
jgi:hypothetical protein